MNPFVQEIVTTLAGLLAMPQEDLAASLEIPQDPKMGDYALPCFTLAKVLKRSPQGIAADLAQKLPPSANIASIQPKGPYLNFFVHRPKLIEMVLSTVASQGERYGFSTLGAGRTIVVDFSSPNIAKHLAVHHLRSTMIGNALCNLHRALGYRVVGINYLGDWGTQFGQLIVAFKRWGNEEVLKGEAVTKLNELYVRFHKEAEQDATLNDEARAWFKRLESGDPEARQYWERFRAVSLAEFQEIYSRLGVRFDVISGESLYNEKMEATIQRLKDKGLATLSEGALIVDLERFEMPPCLLRKSDGATLYATRDICAAEDRKQTYDFHKLIYVVGSEQRLHLRQVFKVLELMGYEWAKNCVHVDFGRIHGMSTRKGAVVLLADVLDEAVSRVQEIISQKNPSLEDNERVAKDVGVGAVVFFDLSARRVKDVRFNWDEILNFEGETGPYVQYSHVRLCSVLEKYDKPVDSTANFALLEQEDEFALVRMLERFPQIVEHAAHEFEPSILAGFLLNLCSTFNGYYHNHRILGDDAELTRARILLVDCLRCALKNGLRLLGLTAPERM